MKMDGNEPVNRKQSGEKRKVDRVAKQIGSRVREYKNGEVIKCSKVNRLKSIHLKFISIKKILIYTDKYLKGFYI